MSGDLSSRSATPAADEQRRGVGIGGPTRQRGRSDLVAFGLGVVLSLPQVVLGANTVQGQRVPGVTATVELLGLLAALLVGIGAAGLLLHGRLRSRGAVMAATLLALLIGAGGIVAANLWPPPFITSYAAAGVPTLNGFLNALYFVLIFGSGAAALRLAAHAILRVLRHARAPR